MTTTPTPPSPPPASLIEQATIPLVARTTAECCDLAVLYYGRFLYPLLRLYLSLAIPAVCFVFGMMQFVGGGFALMIATLLLVSKPLGLLTISGAARSTFNQAFDRHAPLSSLRISAANRLGHVTASMLSGGSLIAIIALLLATIDDRVGPGRVAQLGPMGASTFVVLLTGLLLANAAFIHCRDYDISSALRRTFLWHMLIRFLAVMPLGLPWLVDAPSVFYLVFLIWLPLASLFLLFRSHRVEVAVLTDFDENIFGRGDQQPLKHTARSLSAQFVFVSALMLFAALLLGSDLLLRTLGASRGIFDPLWEGLDGTVETVGMAFQRLFQFPRFGAAVTAGGLFVYQLGRLALYFLFLDARIRHDCWDMELLLARETRRVEEGA